ncbi:MAG: FlgO family outer membrane protein [Campylobacterota bacterium]
MRLFALAFFSMFLFGGCTLPDTSSVLSGVKNFTQTDFTRLSSSIVDDVCQGISKDELDKDFYVIDFVNIDNLENNSQLGFVLSNQLKSDLLKSCKGITVKELELGKNIKLGRNGSKILTRELDEIKSKVVDENSNLVIGTYAITSDNLMIFVKVVDLATGIIKSSSTVNTTLTQEILGLEGYTPQQSQTQSNPRGIYRPLVL